MGIWGVESGSCYEELLKPLGLISYGGLSINNEMFYRILNRDKTKQKISFDVNVKDIKNIKSIYSKYIKDIRKHKINRINERI